MPISDAESVVMDVLWTHGAQTADEVVAALATRQDWAEPTIKTLLNRLLKKGAVRADKEGRRYRYVPVLAREDWVMTESKGMLDRLFGGRVAPLVAHFSAHRKLGKRDIAELRRLIDSLEQDQANDR